MHDITMARLDPAWKPWSVPRAVKVLAPAQILSVRSRLIEKWMPRRYPTPFQRCLAIHIINATYPANDDTSVSDAA